MGLASGEKGEKCVRVFFFNDVITPLKYSDVTWPQLEVKILYLFKLQMTFVFTIHG